MKRLMAGGLMLAALLPAAQGQWEKREDASAPVAMVTLSDASRWQAGLAYAHVSRTVEMDVRESRLQGDVADVFLGFSVAPWLQLYGQTGVSRARVDDLLNPRPGAGAGGLLGAKWNLWQFHGDHPEKSWRFTIPLDAQIAHRTTDDKGAGEIRWTEILVMLPLDYHLTFAHNSATSTCRNSTACACMRDRPSPISMAPGRPGIPGAISKSRKVWARWPARSCGCSRMCHSAPARTGLTAQRFT
jgi:hypothetical protein